MAMASSPLLTLWSVPRALLLSVRGSGSGNGNLNLSRRLLHVESGVLVPQSTRVFSCGGGGGGLGNVGVSPSYVGWQMSRGGAYGVGRCASSGRCVRSFAASASSTAAAPAKVAREHFMALNTLSPPKGDLKRSKRLGRGIGSGKGKTSGRGHKGQKARGTGAVKFGFDGQATPQRMKFPKRGFRNTYFRREMIQLNLEVLQKAIMCGRIDATKTITMKELRDARVIPTFKAYKKHGVKLLANGKDVFQLKNLDIELTGASKAARKALQANDCKLTTVYYSKLGLRALLRPEWFPKKGRLIPKPARPPPKLALRFDCIGGNVMWPKEPIDANTPSHGGFLPKPIPLKRRQVRARFLRFIRGRSNKIGSTLFENESS
ncbi:hypothetical protein PPROV_000738300 [Pycnococcus provasolii]|uniref:Large ribosomal subunit protein uL15/eL18 domain-containing protein n=1 Tax=Pycnococcus provasolii TaxID=41880 RepID=A0A830HMJ3_9CHLO|nr:hypothetical protein PPROV_000738300 [Pycnococcus provasolii]